MWDLVGNPEDRFSHNEAQFIVDDFKPASVDTSQEAQVEVGEGHHVTLTVPHVEVSSFRT